MTLTQAAHDVLTEQTWGAWNDSHSNTARSQRWLDAHPDAPFPLRVLRDAVTRETRLRGARARIEPQVQDIRGRLAKRIITQAEEEIARRSISTCTGMGRLHIIERDSHAHLALLGWTGWVRYSSRAGSWPQAATYLMGRDEGQNWIARVPSTCGSISDALQAITPAAVRAAEATGRVVVRQGDVWLVEQPRANEHDLSALRGTRHELAEDEQGLLLNHPEHGDLRLPAIAGYWRAYQARVDVGARGAGSD